MQSAPLLFLRGVHISQGLLYLLLLPQVHAIALAPSPLLFHCQIGSYAHQQTSTPARPPLLHTLKPLPLPLAPPLHLLPTSTSAVQMTALAYVTYCCVLPAAPDVDPLRLPGMGGWLLGSGPS